MGKNGKYVPHLDNDKVGESSRWRNFRVLTAIMYLNNEAWDSNDGGELVCHLSSGDNLKILPSSGSVVLFDSRKMMHEVCGSPWW